MANKKISELPSATTPLSGAEEMEIVQGGINKKVAVEEAGLSGGVQAISGDGVDNTDPQNPVITINPYTYPFPQFTTATSTTAYTGTPSPVISAYATGQKFQVKIHATSTGASTLNLNSVGAKKVFINPTTQAATGDLLINQIYIFAYDAALDTAAGGFLMIGSGGGPAGWLVTGITNLTGDTTIDNDVHNLLIGDVGGPWSSHDIDGSGPTTVPNSQAAGSGDPSGTDYSFFFNRVDLADNNAFQVQSASAAGGVSQFNIGSSAAGHGFASFQLTDGVNQSDFTLEDTGFSFLTNSVARITIGSNGSLGIDRTITTAGTTGAQTINKMAGVVNFAAGASSLVVTNSLATTSSIIIVQVLGVDTTPKYAVVTRASGSFTITLNAVAVAELPVAFWLTN